MICIPTGLMIISRSTCMNIGQVNNIILFAYWFSMTFNSITLLQCHQEYIYRFSVELIVYIQKVKCSAGKIWHWCSLTGFFIHDGSLQLIIVHDYSDSLWFTITLAPPYLRLLLPSSTMNPSTMFHHDSDYRVPPWLRLPFFTMIPITAFHHDADYYVPPLLRLSRSS